MISLGEKIVRDEELEKQGEKVQNETALLTTCPSRRATAGCTAGRAAGCNLGKESLECPPGPSVSERSLLQKKRRASAPPKSLCAPLAAQPAAGKLAAHDRCNLQPEESNSTALKL